MCSNCGAVKDDLKLSDRTYVCDCGFETDRDLNAALNLERYYYTVSSTGSARGGTGCSFDEARIQQKVCS